MDFRHESLAWPALGSIFSHPIGFVAGPVMNQEPNQHLRGT